MTMSQRADIVSQLETLADSIANEIALFEPEEFKRLIAAKWRLSDRIDQRSYQELGRDIEWFTRRWPAQSRCFVIDYFPELQDLLLRTYTRKNIINLLDVGAATGAGPALLGDLFATDMLWCRVKVDAIDLSDKRLLFSANNYRSFNYLVGDVFHLAESSYHIVTCSHVLEHVPEPDRFIAQLRKVARDYVIVYAPYAEKELIEGHRNRITEATFVDHAPLSTRI